MIIFCSLVLLSELLIIGSCLSVEQSDQSANHLDIHDDPTELVKLLLERSILASHKRPRKAVSYSVVKFKNENKKPKRKDVYPSTWGNFILYCRTGWLLQILPNGIVNGTNNINEVNAVMQVQVIGPTKIRIKGIESGRYIAINSRGRLISKRYPTRETVFQEEVLENHYHTFNSWQHSQDGTKPWYIGIRKNGYPKKASKTKVGNTCIQFLKIPLSAKK
ncbi:fibroblast growth factor 1-like [Rhopilema esculentum]|uniref:fibroblast growth factor 1-like n=1 Tax=Rhopilema esculentum TaxID=499914 RepID=UPI0031D44E5E